MLVTQTTEPSISSIQSNEPTISPAPIVIKYGGNAMTSPKLQSQIIQNIAQIFKGGVPVILVHGGGPFIQEHLDRIGLESHFIGGHRFTSEEAMKEIQMILKGAVNSDLVRMLNQYGVKAVGLSGKDGGSVRADLRAALLDGKEESLGQVGDVTQTDATLLGILLQSGYLPVLASIAIGPNGEDLNVNADMFAGHIAGAVGAQSYLVLTDVDGLRTEKDDPNTLIPQIKLAELEKMGPDIIVGGMIPKIESCALALRNGARSALIVNGTKPELLLGLVNNEDIRCTQISL